MLDCALCDPSLGPVLGQSLHWKIVLNHNQILPSVTTTVSLAGSTP
jgi:hypothetical protein